MDSANMNMRAPSAPPICIGKQHWANGRYEIEVKKYLLTRNIPGTSKSSYFGSAPSPFPLKAY